MTVRRLTEDDAELYRDLRLEGLRNVPTAFGSSYEESERRPLSAYAERLRPTEDTAVFGAFEQGSLVGSVGLFRESGLKERHKAMLWGMYVTPAARRTGVARQLVSSLIEAAGGMQGVLQVKLAVEGTNAAALALYRSFGFEVYGREPRALLVDGSYYDEDLMVLFLDQRDTSDATAITQVRHHGE